MREHADPLSEGSCMQSLRICAELPHNDSVGLMTVELMPVELGPSKQRHRHAMTQHIVQHWRLQLQYI